MLTKQERGIILFLIGASICGLIVLYHRNTATPPVMPQVIGESKEKKGDGQGGSSDQKEKKIGVESERNNDSVDTEVE